MKQDKNDNVIVAHSHALMPHLHEHHQLARVLYSVANLDIESEQYRPYFDSVHVDEKVFLPKNSSTCTLCQVKQALRGPSDTRGIYLR
jgi:hypothetical protein